MSQTLARPPAGPAVATARTCSIRSLPNDLLVAAAAKAIELNPANAPAVQFAPGVAIEPEHLAVLTAKYWEFYRVVRHETGHTLGFPHEHLRAEIVNRIDPAKAIAFFQTTYGWSAQQTTYNVLTAIPNSALIATAQADTHSIMAYWLPASIMKDGIAVDGGTNIDALDAQFAASVYPLAHVAGWHHNDISAGGAPAAAGDPDGYVFEAQGTQHVVYRGTDAGIHELWWDPTYGWSHSDLSAATGAPTAIGGPDGYVFAAQATQHVVYRGTDAGIHELWWAAGSGWSHADLSGETGAPVAAGEPCGYLFRGQGTQHVVFRGNDAHLHEEWWG